MYVSKSVIYYARSSPACRRVVWYQPPSPLRGNSSGIPPDCSITPSQYSDGGTSERGGLPEVISLSAAPESTSAKVGKTTGKIALGLSNDQKHMLPGMEGLRPRWGFGLAGQQCFSDPIKTDNGPASDLDPNGKLTRPCPSLSPVANPRIFFTRAAPPPNASF